MVEVVVLFAGCSLCDVDPLLVLHIAMHLKVPLCDIYTIFIDPLEHGFVLFQNLIVNAAENCLMSSEYMKFLVCRADQFDRDLDPMVANAKRVVHILKGSHAGLCLVRQDERVFLDCHTSLPDWKAFERVCFCNPDICDGCAEDFKYDMANFDSDDDSTMLESDDDMYVTDAPIVGALTVPCVRRSNRIRERLVTSNSSKYL